MSANDEILDAIETETDTDELTGDELDAAALATASGGAGAVHAEGLTPGQVTEIKNGVKAFEKGMTHAQKWAVTTAAGATGVLVGVSQLINAGVNVKNSANGAK